MDQQADTNAAIWQSAEIVQAWAGEEAGRERGRTDHRGLLAQLLPFAGQAFTFLDLGAGTGAASRAILTAHPRATAILADFSAEMMSVADQQMQPFAGRYRYVEFDMAAGVWPAAIPATLEAVVTSMCVHHLTDERKQGLFTEIFARLAPGGWYFNYDPVRAADPLVEATWEQVNDRQDPEAAERRRHRTPPEQARWDNHVRFMIPLGQQLDYLRSAGFEGIDVYYKQLENVIYGGRRPAAGA